MDEGRGVRQRGHRGVSRQHRQAAHTDPTVNEKRNPPHNPNHPYYLLFFFSSASDVGQNS